jgi:hypothetical protein
LLHVTHQRISRSEHIVLASGADPAVTFPDPSTTSTETLGVTLPFAVVGVIVARRQPSNAIGWLILGFALGFLLSIDAGSYDLCGLPL